VSHTLGSRLQPNREKFRTAVAHLIGQVETALQNASSSPDTLIDAHNAYTTYSVLSLLHLTGHRPVQDPFCYRSSMGDGFAVVEDKAVTKFHACRVLILPDTAQRQLQSYERHLLALADRLTAVEGFKLVSADIRALLNETGGRQPLPQFFFLHSAGTESVTEASLNAHLDDWPWPLNAGRHFIATDLRNLGIPAELIDFQLGHLMPEKHFCGPASTLSVAAARDRLAPALEQLAPMYGFRVIPGLPPQPYLAVGKPRTARVEPRAPNEFGPEKRKRQRIEARKEDQELVDLLCRQEAGNRAVDQAMLDRIAAELEIQSAGEPYRLSRRLQMLWNWAINQRKASKAFRLPSRYLALLPPPSPFYREFPERALRAERWRKKFVDYLTNAGRLRHAPSAAQRLSEIIVSAALFGGCADEQRLIELIDRLPADPRRFGDIVFIDSTTTDDDPDWRWMADNLTAALMSNLSSKAHVTRTDASAALAAVLKTLAPGVPIQHPFKALAENALAYWQFRLPGFVYATISGKVSTKPLSQRTLARLLDHVRLEPTETAIPPSEDADSAPIRTGGAGRRAVGLELMKAARKVLNQLNKTEARGHRRANRTLKMELSRKFRALLADVKKDTPAIAILCLAWTIHLAEFGTRRKKNLAFGTVDQYFHLVTRLFVDCASDVDFLNLDELTYETIYGQILNCQPRKTQETLAGRILEFHSYLVDTWCVECPDWSFLPLPREKYGSPGSVDANFLTPSEYKRALRLLDTDPAVDAQTRMKSTALLVIGYRFGSRISDALRLQYEDLVLKPKQGMAVIHAHTNLYGMTKSAAGNRQVPLVGSLDADEWRVLARLKAYFEERIRPEYPRASLFANPESPRAPIERRAFLDRVHLAMRTTSGDPTLRYHHLRHSFDTRTTVAVVLDIGGSEGWDQLTKALWESIPDPAQIRQLLTGTTEIREATLQILPLLMGHASAETGLHHYFHMMEGLVQAIANSVLPVIPDFAWSYVLGDPYDTVRKRSLRLKQRNGHAVFPAGPGWATSIATPTIPVAKGRGPLKLPGKAEPPARVTLEMADRILLAAAARGGETDGIADRLRLSEDHVSRLVTTAREIDLRAGKARVSVVPRPDYIFASATPLTLDSSVLKETPRLREGLRIWQTRMDTLTTAQRLAVHRALKAWHASMPLEQDNAVFTYQTRLVTFLEGLRLLGVQSSYLKALVHMTNPQSKEFLSMRAFLNGAGVTNVTATKDRLGDFVQLALVPATTVFGYTTTLNRALFVTLAALSANNP